MERHANLISPIGTLKDKFLVMKLRNQLTSSGYWESFEDSEASTFQVLQDAGFSGKVFERIFRPFFGGVFNDPDLQTPKSTFELVFRSFAQGPTTLPEEGMEAIPKQLASRIPQESIRTGTRVVSIRGREVDLESGKIVKGRVVVIATEGPQASKLLGISTSLDTRKTTCLYFVADEPPLNGPYLVLNGEGKGPVNHLCLVTQVVPSYAQDVRTFISVTALEDDIDQLT